MRWDTAWRALRRQLSLALHTASVVGDWIGRDGLHHAYLVRREMRCWASHCGVDYSTDITVRLEAGCVPWYTGPDMEAQRHGGLAWDSDAEY